MAQARGGYELIAAGFATDGTGVFSSMRKLIQAAANKFGYRIEKIRGLLPGPYLNLSVLVFGVLDRVTEGGVRFIQVGAFDGEFQDPLYDWIAHRPTWRGILVEPQPVVCQKLLKLHANHPSIEVEQAVVSAKPGKMKLWTPDGSSPIASLDRARVERNAGAATRIVSIDVQAYSLGDLMGKHGLSGLDLLQIDAEGHDFEIIKSIDFDKCNPHVISYEHSNLSPDEQIECRLYLGRRGYSFACEYPADTIACSGTVLAAINASIGG